MNIASMTWETLSRKRKVLRRELLERPGMQEVRIAILGGSTTNEVMDFLELLLLDREIRPIFYQSEYNQYFEDAVVDQSKLKQFNPQIVYVHTSSVNIRAFPSIGATESELSTQVSAETARFAEIWKYVHDGLGSVVIQNNFEPFSPRLLGNFDAVSPSGRTRFINCLNVEFARLASQNGKLLINDLNAIAAGVGMDQFSDPRRWFSYKLIATPRGNLEIARSVAAIIGSIYGRSRKCLVLDLDNTLWGGVIGDDGLDKIKIGKETAEAEAYTAFQQYCLDLQRRGIVLAVCSKNDEATAKRGFAHPDSVLRLSHFASFRANWSPKNENIQSIAAELNLGLDSLVFVDDNPAEREIVSAQLPLVAVPEMGSDVSQFIPILEAGRYFEPISLSAEDLSRARQYQAKAQSASQLGQFANYDEYLESLEMTAHIAPFEPLYLTRISQLINKTNQFNLTTRRYTLAEVEQIASDHNYITLYGRLTDKFGDHGLISVIIGRRELHRLHLDLWLMSCRVLKRDMELAMLDSLCDVCVECGVKEILGYYVPSEKNGLVRDHYATLGFEQVSGDPGRRCGAWL